MDNDHQFGLSVYLSNKTSFCNGRWHTRFLNFNSTDRTISSPIWLTLGGWISIATNLWIRSWTISLKALLNSWYASTKFVPLSDLTSIASPLLAMSLRRAKDEGVLCPLRLCLHSSVRQACKYYPVLFDNLSSFLLYKMFQTCPTQCIWIEVTPIVCLLVNLTSFVPAFFLLTVDK